MSETAALLKAHPQWPAVEFIYHKLQAQGYKAFLAGGCVRDALLGIPANDLDLATDAVPAEVERIFEKTVNVGKSFGVMRVLEQGQDIEVATFRTDGNYVDGRRPEGVHFSTPEEDAQRRDFTVNALFYDLASEKVLDYVEGEKDLRRRVLATVGAAELRFKEDHLRLLRAARFVAQLDFEMEEGTFQALQKMAPLVTSVSGERLHDEMAKLLKSAHVEHGLSVMVQSGLMRELFAFRAGDASWRAPFKNAQSWQDFAIFFRFASFEELQRLLGKLRFSNKEQKAISTAWEVLNAPEKLLSLSRPQQLLRLPQEGVLWALTVLELEGHPRKSQMQDLQDEWREWGEALPSAFLSGKDVPAAIQGPAIGECLAKAFELQLDKKLTTREQALAWIQKYKKDLHD